MEQRYVALLRGINVGGKNMVRMEALRSLFESAGGRQVKTLLQSGNVLFSADPADKDRVVAAIDAGILQHMGVRIPVVFRSAAQIQKLPSQNPFLTSGAPERELYVMFLQGQPSPEAASSLDPQRSPPDEFSVVEDSVFLRLQTGAADTKLTNAYFDAKLKTVSTARNWRTCMKLMNLMQGS